MHKNNVYTKATKAVSLGISLEPSSLVLLSSFKPASDPRDQLFQQGFNRSQCSCVVASSTCRVTTSRDEASGRAAGPEKSSGAQNDSW